MTNEASTTSEKVSTLLLNEYNKVSLSFEIGISRPTLDSRINRSNWKKSEIEMINKLFKKIKS